MIRPICLKSKNSKATERGKDLSRPGPEPVRWARIAAAKDELPGGFLRSMHALFSRRRADVLGWPRKWLWNVCAERVASTNLRCGPDRSTKIFARSNCDGENVAHCVAFPHRT